MPVDVWELMERQKQQKTIYKMPQKEFIRDIPIINNNYDMSYSSYDEEDEQQYINDIIKEIINEKPTTKQVRKLFIEYSEKFNN